MTEANERPEAEEPSYLETAFQKMVNRTLKKKHVDAREFLQREMFPFLRTFLAAYQQSLTNVDENFAQIYATMRIANESNFLDFTLVFFKDLSNAYDQMMARCGYGAFREDGVLILSEDCPAEIREQHAAFAHTAQHWFEMYEAMQDIAEDDDIDDDDEDDDDEEDDLGEEEQQAVDPVVEETQPAQEAVSETKEGAHA